MDSSERIHELYESLDRRRRPEDIAELILGELDDLSGKELRLVQKVASRSIRRGWMGAGASSMSEDFRRPTGMDRQLDVAEELFRVGDRPSGLDTSAIDDYLVRAERKIAKSVGKSDFKYDRLNRMQRVESGLDLSKRQYNKRFRLASRMERKREQIARESEKREITLMSKSGLASKIPLDEFASDRSSACFIAYYTARCNLRSEFTIRGQQRPYDEVCDLLFRRCKKSAKTNWWAIAQSFPDREVLARLDDGRKGELLGRYFSVLARIAVLLKEIWDSSGIDSASMIVRRGNDSTTWNVMAGAWNKARNGWFALLHALKMEDLLERMCPGKVLRLMAADVAEWHRMSKGGLDPDTFVWNEIPYPWLVVSGEKDCPRKLVEETCLRHGVEPVSRGWTSSKTRRRIFPYKPTPELVHGVSVGDPELARILRKIGYFSGKGIKMTHDA